MLIRILDTNVLLDRDIEEIIRVYESDIVLPAIVVKELDTFKKLQDSRGRNARSAIRFIDKLAEQGDLKEGVQLNNGITFKIEANKYCDIPNYLDPDAADTKILMVAKAITEINGEVELITQDICVRVLANIMGIKASGLARVEEEHIYSGYTEIHITGEQIQKFHETGRLRTMDELLANQFVGMVDDFSGITYGKYDSSIGAIVPLERNYEAFGLKAKRGNTEQKFLMDLLLNDEIKLVTAIGKAGTGKTIMSLACGLQKVIEERKYDKVVVSRLTIPVGEDLGYLPGTKDEKLGPWMGAIFDNLDVLCEDFQNDSFLEQYIELEALTYIRGRSIPKQWIIIDEAQNITTKQAKTIITRAGEGTKIILIGDIEQIDNPELSCADNGLVRVINALMGQPLYGHITLDKTERSELAELAATLL